MRQSTPPHNLPVVPLNYQAPWERGDARPRNRFRWGNYEVREESLARFKAVLEGDLGAPLEWSDDELRIMLRDMVHLFAILLDGPCPNLNPL